MMDKCKKCRKFGNKLFLKGARCETPKCAFTRRSYKPGQHGAKQVNARKSEYGLQLMEKQKAKAEYGMREKQFSNTFLKASKSKQTTGEKLLQLLETRLDNLIYRLGWAKSRSQARQCVTHGYFKVNGKKASIPSMNLLSKDKIEIAKKVEPEKVTLPKWIKVDSKNSQAEILRLPTREEIETDLDEQLIIEFYSR